MFTGSNVSTILLVALALLGAVLFDLFATARHDHVPVETSWEFRP